jgi:endo-1,3-1,4-beta-glycanase ExoK
VHCALLIGIRNTPKVIHKLFPGIICFILVTSCNPEKKEYIGAEIYSLDTVKYGKFEIRMRMAGGDGIVSSFFLFGINAWKDDRKKWLEIDLEAFGKNNRLLQTNIITGSRKVQKQYRKLYYSDKPVTDSFHIYTLEWTPDYIAWLIDHKKIRVINDCPQVRELRSEALSYRFNTWVSSEPFWAGFVNQKSIPACQSVDWVKYYRYVPEHKERFVLSWVDEFNCLDRNRWATGTWTFDRNLATFSPKNITIANGYILLRVTKIGTLTN